MMSAPLSNIEQFQPCPCPTPIPIGPGHLSTCENKGSIWLLEGFWARLVGDVVEGIFGAGLTEEQDPSQNLGCSESRALWSPSRGRGGGVVAAWGSLCKTALVLLGMKHEWPGKTEEGRGH